MHSEVLGSSTGYKQTKVVPWQEDASQKVLGSNPSAGKVFFWQNPSYYELEQSYHLIVELVRNKSVSCFI